MSIIPLTQKILAEGPIEEVRPLNNPSYSTRPVVLLLLKAGLAHTISLRELLILIHK